MQTAFDLVRRAAQRTPKALALADAASDRNLTYEALISEVEAVAAGLTKLGISRGSAVATILPNSWEHALTILATQRLGAVSVQMNARLKPVEAAALLKDAKANAIVCANDAAMIAALGEALPGVPILSTGGASGEARDFAACRADPASLAPPPKPDPEETAFLFYTSGTTGLPKAAMVPHRASEARILFAAALCGITSGTQLGTQGLMPLFHIVGFSGVFLPTLAFSGTYVTAPVFDPAAALATIEKRQLSYLFLSPTHLSAILSVPGFAPERMRSVRHLLYGGAPTSDALLQRIADGFAAAKLIHIYGTTEVMTALHMPEPMGRGTRFRPGFGTNIAVCRIGGGVNECVSPGEEGELLIDATNDGVFTGYLGRPDLSAQKLQDGWYRTGDVVRLCDDGDVELRGRVDDMIITGAENVHPEEVEAVLLRHDKVAEVSVIGVADEHWGQRIVACVVPRDPALNAAALEAYCLESPLARYKRPRSYRFMGALPRNASNKVLRRVLREQAEIKS
jgi:acyl-CoA synthetase (AMP-forming)/AMP-acid ligase II